MPQAPLPFADIAVEDWDDLLRAVTARLRQAVTATLPHELNGATAPLQTSVLECVDALEQLHASLRQVALPRGRPLGPAGDDGRAAGVQGRGVGPGGG